MSTFEPYYATGARVITSGNGQLRVVLGGRDNYVIWEMSGGWRRSFSLTAAKPVTVTFDYRLDQTPHYESDEYSDALLSIDGRIVGVNGGSFLSRIRGNGNGGAVISTGVKRISVNLGTLAAGTHTLTLGGFNLKKTSYDESTSVFFDNVKVTTAP
ncbi:MAG: hypothetical protein FJ190_06875 [Gammaproteobacteria bacterium]|nr:hypothetical protein [Gammaproteobacteria bacterium]